MSSPTERVAPLAAAARRRHDDARRRAVAAIRSLDHSGTAVSVSAVARTASVSRAWLYRQADLLASIEQLRQDRPRRSRLTPVAERRTDASLHQQVDALRARCTELEDENRKLREALAHDLGHRRRDPHGDSRP
jgi:hypothetical protein